MHSAFYASAEYKSANCETGYYTLGAPVRPGALLLRDLFAGRARLQTIAESEAVTLAMPASPVAKVNAPLPAMVLLSPPLFCSTSPVPERPLTVPPIV
mgnify:CR=1 FL=1